MPTARCLGMVACLDRVKPRDCMRDPGARTGYVYVKGRALFLWHRMGSRSRSFSILTGLSDYDLEKLWDEHKSIARRHAKALIRRHYPNVLTWVTRGVKRRRSEIIEGRRRLRERLGELTLREWAEEESEEE